MYLPDYKGGSIVNLMSSIKKGLGGKHPYKELKLLPSDDFRKTKNTTLIIIDGLGYEFLKKNMSGTVFEKNIRGNITSVFPATTGTAIPTFGTGFPPQQTALTGWFVFLKEIGIVSKTLPFTARIGGEVFSNQGIDIKKIYDLKPFNEDLKISSFIVKQEHIINSDFTITTLGKAKRLSCSTIKGFFSQIKKAINIHNQKKYIHAYWDEFDALSHTYGTNSKESLKHFKEIAKELKIFLNQIKGTNTKVIITSDHGFFDSNKEEKIKLEDHPKLRDCLMMPLCGDSRVAYCYLKKNKEKEFVEYIKNNFKDKCYLYKSEDLIKKGFFGLYKPNPKLLERIGDYTIIFKKGYSLVDKIKEKKSKPDIGKHSGVTKDEMIVPLIVINT